MNQLLLSIAMAAIVALTACGGQSRVVNAAAPGAADTAPIAAVTDSAPSTLDLTMIDAGAPTGGARANAAVAPGLATCAFETCIAP